MTVIFKSKMAASIEEIYVVMIIYKNSYILNDKYTKYYDFSLICIVIRLYKVDTMTAIFKSKMAATIGEIYMVMIIYANIYALKDKYAKYYDFPRICISSWVYIVDVMAAIYKTKMAASIGEIYLVMIIYTNIYALNDKYTKYYDFLKKCIVSCVYIVDIMAAIFKIKMAAPRMVVPVGTRAYLKI